MAPQARPLEASSVAAVARPNGVGWGATPARRTLLAAAALALSLFAPLASGHLEPIEPGPAPPGGPLTHVHCEDSVAAGFACHHVDLLAQLPLSSFGAGTANDGWGWTDPETGRKYALADSSDEHLAGSLAAHAQGGYGG